LTEEAKEKFNDIVDGAKSLLNKITSKFESDKDKEGTA
jgi:hypothetical protein